MNKIAKAKRDHLLEEYYTKVYGPLLFGGGVQGCGIAMFERAVEAHWTAQSADRILELGAGSGEHLGFVQQLNWDLYVALDLSPNRADSTLLEEAPSRVVTVQGDAQELPFADAAFDRVTSTCLLHHVTDPLAVLLEVRRVLRPGGEFAVVLPTDPGMANRFVKFVATFPRIRRMSGLDPALIYALEHRNHIQGLLTLIRHVFAADRLGLHYGPLLIPSWNANLWVVAHVTRGET